eukprot:403361148
MQTQPRKPVLDQTLQQVIPYLSKQDKLRAVLSESEKGLTDLSKIIGSQISQISDQIVTQIVNSKREQPINFPHNFQKNKQDLAPIIRKLKAKFKKKQLQESLFQLTMNQNAISKKEYDQKLQVIKDQQQIIEEFLEEDNKLKEKLGIVSHLKEVQDYHDRVVNQEDKTKVIQKQKKAKSFIKRIHIEKREREYKQQQIQESLERKQKLLEQKMIQEQKERQIQNQEDYSLKKQEIKDKILKRTEDRIKFKNDTEFAIKNVLQQKPVYVVIEEKYKEYVEMPQLESVKQKLKELRDFHKPINKLGIDKHTKHYEAQRRIMEDEIKRQRSLSHRREEEHIANLKYKPHLHDEEFDQQRRSQIEEYERIRAKREKYQEKVQNYAKFVKEVYWPKISEDKKQELKTLQEKQTNHRLTHIRSASQTQKYKNYLEDVKSQLKHNNNGRNSQQSLNGPSIYDSVDLNREDYDSSPDLKQKSKFKKSLLQNNMSLDTLKLNSQNYIRNSQSQLSLLQTNPKYHNPIQLNSVSRNNGSQSKLSQSISQQQIQTQQKQQGDYLKLQRNKRVIEESEGKKSKQFVDDKIWNNYLHDQTVAEYKKIEDIRRMAAHIEEKAKMNEKLVKLYNNDSLDNLNLYSTKNIQRSIDANDRYLEAIKVKLKVLDHL